MQVAEAVAVVVVDVAAAVTVAVTAGAVIVGPAGRRWAVAHADLAAGERVSAALE